tara:strand:+ start:542 stop:1129 length:588 start_codon:yes stop_codon:yes gene_type:complete
MSWFLEGKLPKTCLLQGIKRLDCLRFCHADVFEEIEKSQGHDFHRLNSVASMLGTSLTAVKKLISPTEGGPLLMTVEPAVSGKLAGSAYVSAAEIERFKAEYLTPGLVGRMFGVNWTVVRRILKQQGVEPVADPKLLGVWVYRRRDVLSVASYLVAEQPSPASIRSDSFKAVSPSGFFDKKDEKGETGESDASVR